VVLFRELATSQMEFAQLLKLDRAFQTALAQAEGILPGLHAVRLALLGSASTAHLVAGIRVAGLRRGLAVEVYESAYGMYRQELADMHSGLHTFQPEFVLFALDARQLGGADGSTPEAALDLVRSCWNQAKSSFHCQVIQQAALPVFPVLLGNNEQRLADSPATVLSRINEMLRAESEASGVDLLAVDQFAAVDGIAAWYDPAMWHRSKHEIHPGAAESYGEQVVRLIAAGQGLSAKCLVLDLDNTLWGGVIGDDGLEGIELGQGSGNGEAFVEFQRYVKRLAQRGVILAVCSKNDEENALEVFLMHPEMVLKQGDIACFVANWKDKATNLRSIAEALNIGLDAMVFVDDNAAERALVRRELPMVKVPELPDDPSRFADTLASAGYFEALHITEEDFTRGASYKANALRETSKAGTADIESYLESLDMTLMVQAFDRIGLTRITQLINKTNQFNLTSKRLCEAEVSARISDPCVITLQARLTDRFGDNGIVAALSAKILGSEALIDLWLMSCRVLGRRVEDGCLNALVESCRSRGVEQLVGVYRPANKNGMVRDLYGRLGFCLVEERASGETRWKMDLRGYVPKGVPMRVHSRDGAFAQTAR
jgi:FkbH-like protein